MEHACLLQAGIFTGSHGWILSVTIHFTCVIRVLFNKNYFTSFLYLMRLGSTLPKRFFLFSSYSE